MMHIMVTPWCHCTQLYFTKFTTYNMIYIYIYIYIYIVWAIGSVWSEILKFYLMLSLSLSLSLLGVTVLATPLDGWQRGPSPTPNFQTHRGGWVLAGGLQGGVWEEGVMSVTILEFNSYFFWDYGVNAQDLLISKLKTVLPHLPVRGTDWACVGWRPMTTIIHQLQHFPFQTQLFSRHCFPSFRLSPCTLLNTHHC